ncbi:MAG: cytochrome b6-f complex subunit 6 [Planktothrix rubescens PR222]|jgi:hypothetical protein
MITADGAIAYVIIYVGALVAAGGILFTLRAIKLI